MDKCFNKRFKKKGVDVVVGMMYEYLVRLRLWWSSLVLQLGPESLPVNNSRSSATVLVVWRGRGKSRICAKGLMIFFLKGFKYILIIFWTLFLIFFDRQYSSVAALPPRLHTFSSAFSTSHISY